MMNRRSFIKSAGVAVEIDSIEVFQVSGNNTKKLIAWDEERSF